MLLILIQGLNCIRLFRRYKNEQKAELQQEREQIEAQRAESMKMLQELQALKAQMSSQHVSADSENQTKAENTDENKTPNTDTVNGATDTDAVTSDHNLT